MNLTRCYPRNAADEKHNYLRTGFPSLDRIFNFAEEDADSSNRLPLTNVTEVESGFVLTLEMPGVKKTDVNVTVDGDQLIVKGESTDKVESKGAFRREFRSARFERSFALGKGIDKDNIKATMDDGVLTVTLQKAADLPGRRVEIA